MKSVVGLISTLTVAGTFVVTAGSHLTRPGKLMDALEAHGALRRRAAAVVAVGVIAAEAAIAGLGLASLAVSASIPRATALFPAAMLLTAFTAYTAWLARYRPNVPCGCGGDLDEVNVWVPARSAGLALLAVLGASLASDPLPVAGVMLGAAAATTMALTLWHLPMALSTRALRILEQGAP